MAKISVWTYDCAYTFLYVTVCNLRTLTDELAHYIQQLLKAELLPDNIQQIYWLRDRKSESTTPLQAPTLLLRLHTALF